MCSCHSILECCVTFSGVKLSIRSFVLLHIKNFSHYFPFLIMQHQNVFVMSYCFFYSYYIFQKKFKVDMKRKFLFSHMKVHEKQE